MDYTRYIDGAEILKRLLDMIENDDFSSIAGQLEEEDSSGGCLYTIKIYASPEGRRRYNLL